MKNMDSGGLMDVSSFLVFEASGDSEQLESDPAMAVSGHGAVATGADEDDAESSCSCDLSADAVQDDDDDEVDCLDAQGYDDYRDNDYDDDDDDDEEEEEEEDGNDGGAWTSRPMGLGRVAFGSISGDRRSSACVDSSKGEKGSEMEKSRLFWEACLAS